MLHERLVDLRQCQNMKQYEVADRVGVVRSTYGGYERGDRVPDANTLFRIADFFHVTTDYLLGRDQYSPIVPIKLIEIANDIPQYKQQEFWNDIIEYAKFIKNKG
jgi:transcriptional regulator with XRE-family HTH domain